MSAFCQITTAASADSFTEGPDRKDFDRKFLEEIATNMSVDRGSLFYYRDDRLLLAHTLDLEHVIQVIDLSGPGEACELSKALRTRQPSIIPDISRAACMQNIGFEGNTNVSAMVYPLVDRANVIVGIVTLYDSRSSSFSYENKIRLDSV